MYRKNIRNPNIEDLKAKYDQKRASIDESSEDSEPPPITGKKKLNGQPRSRSRSRSQESSSDTDEQKNRWEDAREPQPRRRGQDNSDKRSSSASSMTKKHYDSSDVGRAVSSKYAGKLDEMKKHRDIYPAQKNLNLIEEKQFKGVQMFLGNEAGTAGSLADGGDAGRMGAITEGGGVGGVQSMTEQEKKECSWIVCGPDFRSKPPSSLLVTSVNQAHDLLRADGMMAEPATMQHSDEWLKTHGLDALSLSIKLLMAQGKLGTPKPDFKTGKVVNQLSFDDLQLVDFEYRVNLAIEAYSKRIKWYLQGSRKYFGLIQGSNVAVMLDCSDANLNFGRQRTFQQCLLHLAEEQLAHNKQYLQLLAIGTECRTLWPGPMPVNCRSVDEFRLALPGGPQSLCVPLSQDDRNANGCNLLQGLRQLLRGGGARNTPGYPDLDHVVIVLGTNPDQSPEIICAQVKQLLLGRAIRLHCVAYECSQNNVNRLLRDLAEISGGSFHCYSSAVEELVYTSSDISRLLEEIEKCQELLKKVGQLRNGQVSDSIAPIIKGIYEELQSAPHSLFLPKPIGHTKPLNLERCKFAPLSSKEWLRKNGLRVNQLSIYQILRPNAYDDKKGFVPSIRKEVTSSVYKKLMVQVAWYDNSVKNVHADLSHLFEYQKRLREKIELFEKRINWLSTSSRRLFGSLVESRVVFIIDLSLSNLQYLIHIQHSLRLLLEEQLLNRKTFNLVMMGGITNTNTAKSSKPDNNGNSQDQPELEHILWRPIMTPVTEQNLQSAWRWILSLQCAGSRNFIGSIKKLLENFEDSNHENQVAEAFYLFTSGVPDQNVEPIVTYLEEMFAGTSKRLHTVLYNVDDYDECGNVIPGRYANITKTADVLRYMAHCTGGRFHWFRETGIIESDDIRLIMEEIDRTVEYSQMCETIIDTVKRKYPDSLYSQRNAAAIRKEMKRLEMQQIADANTHQQQLQMLPPKSTALSKARLLHLDEKNRDREKIPKTLAWRTKLTESEPNVNSNVNPMISVINANAKGKFREPIKSAFYTENRNQKGVVFKEYPDGYCPRKSIGKAEMNQNEEWLNSKDWLRRYSLHACGLDLVKLISGPDCRHSEKHVIPLKKNVEAKYCSGLFPLVNVRGTMKHLQFTPGELDKYDREVWTCLCRYLKRLEWLMSGSRRVFGAITENSVVILIDVSGSMDTHMDDLKMHLKVLIWEQLFKREMRFNLIAFSTGVQRFREGLVLADEHECHLAVAWTDQLVAHGNTDTEAALMAALHDHHFQQEKTHEKMEKQQQQQETENSKEQTAQQASAVYLLSDGKPDVSTMQVTTNVIERVRNDKWNVSINTISFNCIDPNANTFLQQLAKKSNGRYHHVCSDQQHQFDARLFSQKLFKIANSSTPPTNHFTQSPPTSTASPPHQITPSILHQQQQTQTSCNTSKQHSRTASNCTTLKFVDPDYPNLPEFPGDDLRLIAQEIQHCRRNMTRTRYFREMYAAMQRHIREEQERKKAIELKEK